MKFPIIGIALSNAEKQLCGFVLKKIDSCLRFMVIGIRVYGDNTTNKTVQKQFL
jgi:hypothetical protein